MCSEWPGWRDDRFSLEPKEGVTPSIFAELWKMLILWEIGVWRAAEGRGSLKVVVGMRAAGVMF
jgi:hypothetical protein